MAVFNPQSDVTGPVDTRFLVAWREGHTIDHIDIFGGTNAEVHGSGDSLKLTYVAPGTLGESDDVPISGAFDAVSYEFGSDTQGVLSGISPAANFADIITINAYRIFDGTDTINGTPFGGDFLFAGYGGNDKLDGKGGGDLFQVATRGTAQPALTIKGAAGATDTLFVEKNIFTGESFLDLTGSTLTSIDAITLDPGTAVAIESQQLGAGLSKTASIGAISGTAFFDILKETVGGTLDLLGLTVHPNTILRIFSNGSAETILGTNGAEQFYSRGGADTVNGRGGADIFYLEDANDEFDTINGGAGIDTVRTIGPENLAVLNGFNAAASSIEVWEGDVKGNAAANLFDFRGLTGPAAPNATFVVSGDGGDDTILAPGFQFLMAGEEGNDTLTGGKESDQFLGGAGADTLTGGDQNDLFYYVDVKDSAKKKSLRDTIKDFTVKSDDINLTFIDANGKKKDGDQSFQFVKREGGAFKNKAGSLIWEQIDKAGKAKDMTVVYADTNGDQKADMAIQLKGLVDLKATDFFL